MTLVLESTEGAIDADVVDEVDVSGIVLTSEFAVSSEFDVNVAGEETTITDSAKLQSCEEGSKAIVDEIVFL